MRAGDNPSVPFAGAMAGVVAAVLVTALAATAHSDTTTVATTTVVATTTTPPSTTVSTTATTTSITTSDTGSLAQTTASGTTVTTATGTPKLAVSAAAAAVSGRQLGPGCPVAAAALLFPGRMPLVLGPVVVGRIEAAGLSRLVYPADGSIVSASAVDLEAAGCRRSGPTHARAQIASLSLLGGALTATRVQLRVGPPVALTLSGLTIDGKRTAAIAGKRIPLQRWGYLVSDPGHPTRDWGGGFVLSALAIHFLRPHAGLAARTTLLVAVAALPSTPPALQAARPALSHRSRGTARSVHRPLRVTPPLGLANYVFPVYGPSEYSDTYGAYRSDVSGHWHHGDDIFAPLGTPVFAVADGTITSLGWNSLGGWSLSIEDSAGNEFYYAHLAGYVPDDLHSKRVRAGQVIGFIGNTGDAFTTSPHLHFEVHPRPLRQLGYDGAVDPTSYLNHWAHLNHTDVPLPAHPPLPTQPLLHQEARYVWRELLAARHLIHHPPRPSQRPHIQISAAANGPPLAPPPATAAPPLRSVDRRTNGRPPTGTAGLAALVVLGLLAALLAVAALRRRTIALVLGLIGKRDRAQRPV